MCQSLRGCSNCCAPHWALLQWILWVGVKATTPGGDALLQGFLRRPPLKPLRAVEPIPEEVLTKKLVNFVSIKGEDLLLQAKSENAVRYHRLRASVPGRLWKWRTICGWPWKRQGYHINVLEVEAVHTCLQWRICRKRQQQCRFLHLTDSLVTLHCLSRGRSSSRKLRSVISALEDQCAPPRHRCVSPLGIHINILGIHINKAESSRPSESAPCQEEMGKKKAQLEAKTREERIEQRRRQGTLRSLAVQPATKRRYDAAMNRFLDFLKYEQIPLPKERSKMDDLLAEYIEHLWASGEGRALASDTVAGLQDLEPHLKGSLPTVWRLLKVWSQNELPNRAPPLPEVVVKAMAGRALFKNDPEFALSLLLGFYGMMRTGELLGVSARNVEVSHTPGPAIISLGLTKSGRRQGAAESITVTVVDVVRRLKQWKALGRLSLAPSVSAWRGKFAETLEELGLSSFEFRPYSLRRGGATFWFAKHGSFDRLLVQGRWQAAKTARIYNISIPVWQALQKCNYQWKTCVDFCLCITQLWIMTYRALSALAKRVVQGDVEERWPKNEDPQISVVLGTGTHQKMSSTQGLISVRLGGTGVRGYFWSLRIGIFPGLAGRFQKGFSVLFKGVIFCHNSIYILTNLILLRCEKGWCRVFVPTAPARG